MVYSSNEGCSRDLSGIGISFGHKDVSNERLISYDQSWQEEKADLKEKKGSETLFKKWL